MANSNKKSKKSANKPGTAITISKIPTIEIPIRITIDIKINHSGAETEIPKRVSTGGVSDRLADEPSPNFEYFITANGITVEALRINGIAVRDPGEAGKVFAPVDIETIQVIVDATKVNPIGSGTLQLQFFGKNVFASPKEFEFQNSGGGGLNLTSVPLPL